MAQTLAIIDYGSGNLRSVAKAFERANADAALGFRIEVTDDARIVTKADRVAVPGVGAFGDCYAGLTALPGMAEVLTEAIQVQKRPFFGICVGMQLMASRGLEHGDHTGLGWIEGEVRRLTPSDPALKIPHMGWNELELHAAHPVFAELHVVQDKAHHAYFVHSFAFFPRDPETVLATANYGGPVTAAIARENMIGTQFHPEKSQALGLALLTGFLKWRP